MTSNEPTVVIVPGLRDHVAHHWQTLLEARLRAANRPVVSVPPMGRDDLDCAARVDAIEACVACVEGPVIVVAHSAGVIMVAHWARRYRRPIAGALLAAPPDFEQPMPDGYPTVEALDASGWLPVPREPLPFPSIVAASRNDPLGCYERIVELASVWHSELVDVGNVGHLNPASGFGEWPAADTFIEMLARRA
ncbi:RBBP9/YdeN family alpha/beta hydrolase [Paraburkholderia silviterrae]|uniref:Serine hydrolase family protein n=1 Tax=Paraburkholderia silviterrae TaxID=2528715 RepID=A0A4R5M4L0_9BURK|nr:alpha/beta fold hydrolase [Paraburkholderia silviterrae]TDG20638.1 serine hydrolase family protein [Paraburkholderia silviterrae]